MQLGRGDVWVSKSEHVDSSGMYCSMLYTHKCYVKSLHRSSYYSSMYICTCVSLRGPSILATYWQCMYVCTLLSPLDVDVPGSVHLSFVKLNSARTSRV